MPEERAPEAFGRQPCVLIFSPFPYSHFWGCGVIEPVYPDDTGEVIKRSHQLARKHSALQGGICLRKHSERSSAGTCARLTRCLCHSPLSKALKWSLIYPVSSWRKAERTCPRSSGQCPLWKGPRSSFHRDWIAGGYAWAGTWAGVTLICKIRPLCSGLGRVPGGGRRWQGTYFDPGGLGRPQLCALTFKSTS